MSDFKPSGGCILPPHRHAVDRTFGRVCRRVLFGWQGRRSQAPCCHPQGELGSLGILPAFAELIGRFDEKMVFRPLSPETQREIGQLVISEELARFREQGFDLTISEEAFEFLVRRGIHKTLGARPMKKIAQKFIGDAIRHAMKTHQTPSGTLAVSSANQLAIQTP